MRGLNLAEWWRFVYQVQVNAPWSSWVPNRQKYRGSVSANAVETLSSFFYVTIFGTKQQKTLRRLSMWRRVLWDEIYLAEKNMQYLRSAVMVNPVDLPSDEDANLAVLPPLLVGQQIGDQQGQTWTGDIEQMLNTKFLEVKWFVFYVVWCCSWTLLKSVDHWRCTL